MFVIFELSVVLQVDFPSTEHLLTRPGRFTGYESDSAISTLVDISSEQ